MTITIPDSRKLSTRARAAVLVFLVAMLLGSLPLGVWSAEKVGKYLVYVGTYTNTGSKGIYAYRFDSATGTTESLGLAAGTAEPSFLAVAPNRQFIYAANEMRNYNGEITGALSSFAVDRTTGKLSQLNELPSRGADPAFLSLDKTGKYVLVANYTGGTVAVFPVFADGKLGPASAVVQHTGSSVDHDRQAGPHPHLIVTSPDNRFALVPDLGLDEVIAYRFDAARGTLGEKPSATKAEPGSGPRHIAFSPNGHFVYLISEMGSAVTTFSYHAADAAMAPLQTVPVEPTNSLRKAGAEVQVSASGKFLYASNRFDNIIVVYAIDSTKGTLTQVQSVALEGKTPRHFVLDPTGQWLWEENQDSNTIVIYRVDQKTGQLSRFGQPLDIASPTCVVFVRLP